MARYIDAEKMQVNCLKDKKFVFAMDNPYTQEVIMEIVYKDFLDFLNEQPTADVVEVVHGEWEVHTDEYDCEYAKCSICNEELYSVDEDTFDRLYNYCPNCGAKMDGKKVE